MKRVISYIDGFNLYHSIDDLNKPHLKWLDLRLLTESMLRPGESLKTVKYFSAYATWMAPKFALHRDYVNALVARGVVAHLAQFKEKPRKCRSCGAKWTSHEEKETDVQIAVHMVADALKGDVDRIILISADTDLRPPIKMIAASNPAVEVFVAAPPKRFGRCRSLGPKMQISPGKLAKCLLPATVPISASKSVTRPAKYDPPA